MSANHRHVEGFALMLTQMSYSQRNAFCAEVRDAFSAIQASRIEADINGNLEVPVDVLRDALHGWAEQKLRAISMQNDPNAIPF